MSDMPADSGVSTQNEQPTAAATLTITLLPGDRSLATRLAAALRRTFGPQAPSS
jgi:hypothetical protein